ncbi:PREDICTED: NACHT, LRR and PYD domains-containing protein 3-like [Cyprinodon variegatus]|uniref:NACHT, LRR and PYD domains-containing protein 3-like n=1 Tax=Cyprinodon variegatus TaxID=28743 RepID=UPI00074297E1|nr:PREDICTED: NACHT, LRR and PYD domains-containing protein 3-like [Cyprinodon variegatus]
MSKKGNKIAVPLSEELVLRALKDLGDNELKEFKWYLQKPETLGGFPIIPKSKIDKADRTDMVDQMLQTYCESTLQVTKKILKKLDRNDLVQGLVGQNGEEVSEDFAECQQNLKSRLLRELMGSVEKTQKGRKSKAKEEIYIEMNLAVKENKEFSSEQGIRYIESASRKLTKVEKTVGYDSIFRDRLGENKTARTVLTIGVAGIGKTALTQKFTLNWAEEKTNNEFHFIFPFSFKALSAMKKSLSLVELIHHFFAETKEAEISKFGEFKVIFILDGLDESRLQLDFRLSKKVSDIKEKASVDVLVTNIIKGNLLPNAHIWITSRPAAASQIPAECIDLVTEVTGFNQAQKLLYFRKKCGDQNIHSKIMPYVSASQSLNTLCQMPICCWITATVLEDLLKHKEKEELPKTVTELYINFLQVQFRQKAVTEAEIQWNQSSKDKILTLGKLAFEQLQKGNLVFYDSELKGSGITTKSVSVYTGIFPEIFKDEDVSDQAKVCCFTHLSVQEFLAALYVHLTFTNTQVNVLDEAQSSWMGVLGRRKSNPHHTAVDKALQSPNGELDMFLRFLMGLLLPSSQSLLKGLVKKPENDTKAIEDAIKYIKEKLDNDLSTEHSINLLHCLNELNDNSLVEEIQRFMASGRLTVDCLSNSHWAALVFILLSQNEIDMFDLKNYTSSEEAFMRLIPVARNAKRACLSACELSERGISALNGILSSQNSILKELDLSYNNLGDGGIRQLAEGLESPNCSLEVLRLSGCSLTWKACDTLASVISSQSRLKVLDISNNDLHNEGLESLCAGLENQLCKLECLSLSGCQITEEGCHSLVTALQANPSHLRELDLSYNHPGKEGVQLLSGGVKHKECRLQKLQVEDCGEQRLQAGLKKYACQLELDPNTAHRNLQLSDDNKKVTVVMEEQPYPDHPERFDHCCWQLLCKNGLTGRSYWEVKREGPVIMAVSYKRLSRKGPTADCRLGWNDQCWSLVCSDRQYSFWHNRKETVYTPQYASLLSLRVGVYVDVPAGIISFYAVSANEMFHLHTFKTSFTAPLYPAFGFGFGCWSYNSSVSLCQV